MRNRKLLISLPLIVLLVMVAGTSPARADAYTVTSSADAGAGTLRDAIATLNALPGPHTVDFAPGLAGSTILLSSVGDTTRGPSALVIAEDIEIVGDATSGITIARDTSGPDMRLFYVSGRGALALVNVTLRDGVIRGYNGGAGAQRGGGGGGSAGAGGAIFNEGSLYLGYSTLRNNAAIGGNGASASGGSGLANAGGGAGLNGPGLNANGGAGAGGPPSGGAGGIAPGGSGGLGGTGGGGGGGAYGDGATTGGPGGGGGFLGGGGGGGGATPAGFPGIAGGDGGSGGFGGGGGGGGGGATPGVGGGDFTIFRALGGTGDPSGNGGGGGAGGCGLGGAVFNAVGNVLIENCTFAFNSCTGGSAGSGVLSGTDGEAGAAAGAGLFNYNGTVEAWHATFSDGSLGSAQPGGLVAGALYNLAEGAAVASMDLVDTICANSTEFSYDLRGFDIGGGVRIETGLAYIVEDLGPWLGPPPISTDPLLLPIADNGGPTETYALSFSPLSPAADAGVTTPSTPLDDQRYYLRDAAPDIGAFELDLIPPTVTCSVARGILFPARGALIDPGLFASATDNVDPPSLIALAVGVWSDEAHGPAPFTPDALSLRSRTFLRSDRDIRANGRVYLLRVSATDTTGNVGYGCCTVVVPRIPTMSSIMAVLADASAAEDICNGVPPGSNPGDIPAGYVNLLPDTPLP